MICWQEGDVEEKQEELEAQKHLASKADKRRLEFVEDEARLAQEHGKSMTEDALYATRSKPCQTHKLGLGGGGIVNFKSIL